MRNLVLAFAMLLSATVYAQTFELPPSQPPPVVFPFPPLMPPVAGGLTVPVVPPELPGAPRDLFRVGSPNRVYTPRRVPAVTAYWSGIAYPYPQQVPPVLAPVKPETGLLRLSVMPATAKVFVDGYYLGTTGDIDAQRPITLDGGPHRIDIRAPEYEPLSVNVQITPLEPVTYRGALEQVRPVAPVVERPPASREPMYVIPNCYLGNVPPRPNRLPSGCNIKVVQVLKGK